MGNVVFLPGNRLGKSRMLRALRELWQNARRPEDKPVFISGVWVDESYPKDLRTDAERLAGDMLKVLNGMEGVTAGLTKGGEIAVMTKAGSILDAKVRNIYGAKPQPSENPGKLNTAQSAQVKEEPVSLTSEAGEVKQPAPSITAAGLAKRIKRGENWKVQEPSNADLEARSKEG